MKDTSVDHARIARLVQRVFDEIGPIWAMLVEEGVQPPDEPTGYAALSEFLAVFDGDDADRMMRRAARRAGVTFVGRGNTRAVFAVDGKWVVKVALHHEGVEASDMRYAFEYAELNVHLVFELPTNIFGWRGRSPHGYEVLLVPNQGCVTEPCHIYVVPPKETP